MSFNKIDQQYIAFKKELDEAYFRVMQSGWVIGGEEVEAFENEYADYTRSRYCVGVSSGLAALTLALRACDVGEGDDVIVPSNTYIATWLAVSAVGARPVPVEPDETFCIDVDKIEQAITKSTKAIIPVHLFGNVCEVNRIYKVADKHGLNIIHDAAQAQGAKYRGVMIGRQRDIVCWSFYPTKNLGAFGDAGAITTNVQAYSQVIKLDRSYASDKRGRHAWKGMNARLDTLQAAFLRVKLKHLDLMNTFRRRIAREYTQHIDNRLVKLPTEPHYAYHVYHQFVVLTDRRDELRDHLASYGVPTLVHYEIPPDNTGAYQKEYPLKYPIAEHLSQTMLSLPVDPFMSEEEVERVIHGVNSWK